MKSRARNESASRSSRCCSAAVRGCPSSSTQYVDVTNKQLPPEKFYERLSHVTPRGERSEHPTAETLTKRESAQSAAQSRRAELVEAEVEGSAHEAPKFKFSIRQWWWIIAMIVGIIGIGIVLWLNGTFQPAVDSHADRNFFSCASSFIHRVFTTDAKANTDSHTFLFVDSRWRAKRADDPCACREFHHGQ